MITRNGKHKNGAHILDGVSETLVHGAEEGATRLAEAVDIAGARVSKGAGQFAKGAGQAGGVASELSGQLMGHTKDLSGQLKGQTKELSGQLKGQTKELSGQLKGQSKGLTEQLKGRVAQPPVDLKDAKQSVREAKLGMRNAGQGARELALRSFNRSAAKRGGRLLPSRLLPKTDAMLKAQLVKTSRELAHESSDLNTAVESLNQIIKSNRKAAAKGRTRLIGGLALGAALMYHLDAAQARQRRAATARLLVGIVRGQGGGTPPGAV